MSLRFLTAGESHGKALTGIIDGLPAGVPILVSDINQQLQRRKLGYGRGFRQKIETDEVEILSGIRQGFSLGSPISLLIWNKDWTAWKNILNAEPSPSDTELESQRIVSVPRPGHADLAGGIKYGHSDMRNVLERSSARETTMRVALASVARKFLSMLGISIASRVVEIGNQVDPQPIQCELGEINALADLSPLRCLNAESEKRMIELIEVAKQEGNTVGGVFEVMASGIPVGLGSYSQWDRRLDGKIAKSMMSLNAIKGVEIGLGFESARRSGSTVHDEIVLKNSERKVGYKTNHAGGMEGGISNGNTLVIRAAMKPLSTLMSPLQSVNLKAMKAESAHVERSDVCAVPAAAVISESLLALVLAEEVLEKFGGDSLPEVLDRLREWNARSPIG